MAGSDKDRGSSRRLGAEDQGWSSIGRVLGGRTIKSLGDTVCRMYRAQGDEEHEFIGLASKPRSMVYPGLASKPVPTVSPGLASKPVATGSPDLTSIPVATVSPGLAKNHSLEFSGLGLKPSSYGLVIWPTKSPHRFLGLASKPSGLWFVGCATKLMRG
jgi:hypothetical protein